MKRLEIDINEGALGFQIAPMIDVVFVIMLFFMVMAGAVKVERELRSTLPSNADSDAANFVDEQIVTISTAGEVALNDEPMDSNGDAHLPQLTLALDRLHKASVAAKSPMIVTIISDPGAKYARTVQVFDALAAAHVEDVTFTIAEEE